MNGTSVILTHGHDALVAHATFSNDISAFCTFLLNVRRFYGMF